MRVVTISQTGLLIKKNYWIGAMIVNKNNDDDDNDDSVMMNSKFMLIGSLLF